MQPLGAFDAVPHQQPMTNYQSMMQAPTMFATSNLSGMNIQPLSPALGVMTGNQQSTATWTASAAGFQGGLAFGTQEHTPMVAQPFAGLIPGMQVLAQQPGGQLLPGMVGSQNHVLLNQPLVGQPQPMVPLGTVQAPTGETEADMAPQPMTASAAPESEALVSSDVLDEQTKSMRSLLLLSPTLWKCLIGQLNQILSLTEEQLAALPPEHRDQAVAIRRQLGKMN